MTYKCISIFAAYVLIAVTCLAEESSIARGRYLAVVTGCNDCHTAGFAPSGGKVPESEWLKGDPIGWHGPWGTTYPINLRRRLAGLSPQEWLVLARNSQARPPMPTYALKLMSDQDLLAIYEFVRSLGSAGEEMPAALLPGETPKTPYINFVSGHGTGRRPRGQVIRG